MIRRDLLQLTKENEAERRLELALRKGERIESEKAESDEAESDKRPPRGASFSAGFASCCCCASLCSFGCVGCSGSFDSLAWYGAEYPFEIFMTTIFTGQLRNATERGFARRYAQSGDERLKPFTMFGHYGPAPGEFRWDWYFAQLLQAVLLIGVPARIGSVAVILASLQLPEAISPVLLVGKLWYYSGLSCTRAGG